MRGSLGRVLPPTLVLLFVVLGACAPAAPPDPSRGAGGPQETGAWAPKALTMAIQVEPNIFNEQLAGSGGPPGGREQPIKMAHDYLVVENDRGVYEPRLAREPLSVEKGTWRLNPDGTMDTVWHLHPHIKWQDGTPFTSADLLFSYTVYTDPEIPAGGGGAGAQVLRLMESASAPDPHTFAIHWSSVYVAADGAPGLDPLARHLFEDVYRTDKANLDKSPRLRTDFVGLGPYRLVRWEQGSHLEFVPFEDYHRGRPPLDRVIVRVLADLNTIVASILAGAIDAVPSFVLDLDAAVEVRRRWEGTGHQVNVAVDTKGFQILEVQHRPDYARPRDGLTNLLVRQGLYQAINRAGLAEVMTHGLAPMADSWFAPTHQWRPQLEASIPKLPYDATRARQLLAQAGWRPGADGVLAHDQSGERFAIQISARADAEDERMSAILAEDWKAVGALVTLYTIPAALARDREHLSTHPGVLVASGNADFLQADRLHAKNITSAANRWNGSNRGGYSNPRADALYDRMAVTIDPAQRFALTRDLVQHVMGDVALMPLYWGIEIWMAVEGVKGIKDGGTWNVFEWHRG